MATANAQPQPLFSAAHYAADGKYHILLAASSAATATLPLIARAFSSHHRIVSLRILLPASATDSLQRQSAEQSSLSSLLDVPGVDGIHEDRDEWSKPWVRGDEILHIELRRWAHVLVIAPSSANDLAKIVNGLSDGLLLSVVRAWDTAAIFDAFNGEVKKKRIFVAPEMVTAMWRHPITGRQIRVLEEEWGSVEYGEHKGADGDGQTGSAGRWVTVLRPTETKLASGDVGDEVMMDCRDIVAHVEGYLGLESKHGNELP